MKFLLVFFLFSFVSCKSQNVPSENYKVIFNEDVKKDLLKNASSVNKNYIFLTKDTDKELFLIELNDCNSCYFEELIDKSKDIINLNTKIEVSIIDESSMKKYESSEEVMMKTGGSYIIEVDFQGNIVRSYIGD